VTDPTRAERRAAERSHAERLASRDGYFPPESMIRRIGNSPLMPVLGGGAAVLLQVAHPLVAAGVVEHSDYRAGLWQRLLRTLRALYLITYGTKDEAEQAGARVQHAHARVHGVTHEPLGPFPAGTPYSASDPELMLWVHATLVHVSLELYRSHVRRLAPADEERYYREMMDVARLFGTPSAVIPRTLREFREYFEQQILAGPITVTPAARGISDVIMRAPLPTPVRVLVPAHRLATAGTLPPRLREEYGFRWSSAHRVALHVAARTVHVTSTPAVFAVSRIRVPPGLLVPEA
jgi:uncharacterized protein (DUF2236 family)